MNLKRADGENESKYIWRLCFAKDSGQINLTWPELGKVINEELGYDNTESAYRKAYASVKKFLDDGVFEPDDYKAELESKRRALEMERQKLYATKTEYNRLLRHASREELFYQNIATHIQKLEPPEFGAVSDWIYPNDKEYVLTISDIHAGANFELDTNKYSFEEIRSRFARLAQQVIQYVR